MKKILCLICVLSLCMSFLVGCGNGTPVVDETPKEVDSVVKSKGAIDVSDLSKIDLEGVSVEGNTIKIVGGSDAITEYDLTGSNTDVKLVVDTTNSVINLFVEDSLKMSNKGTVIEVIGTPDKMGCQFYTKGNVTLIDTSEYASEDERQNIINCATDLNIGGEGSIILNSKYGNGIYAAGDIDIDGVNKLTLDVTSVGDCIATGKTISVNPKSMNLVSEEGKCITAEGDLTVDGGTIVIQAGDEGLESKGILAINGGVLDITANDDALNAGTPDALKEEREALNPGHPEMPEGEMPPQWNGENPPPMPEKKPEFNGGKARIGGGGHRKMPELPEGVTPGMAPEKILTEEDLKFFSEHCIEISGGKISITANGDAIDSNGNLTISGGEIFINGPVGFDNSALDCDGAMNISGGKISCVFSGGMIQKPAEGSVKSLVYKFENGLKIGDKIELKDSEGKVIVEHKVGVEAPVFMYLGNEITDGSTYTISLNGTDESTQITIDVNADLKRMKERVE